MTKSFRYVCGFFVLATVLIVSVLLACLSFGFTKSNDVFAVDGENADTEQRFSITYMERLDNGQAIEIPADRLQGNPTSFAISELPITTIKPALAETGYEFNGWYIENNLTLLEYNESTGTYILPAGYSSDIIIYGDFSLIEYSINYINLPAGSNSNAPTTYTINDSIDFTQITPYIYASEFLGWFYDADFTQPVTTIPVGTTGDLTIYANFVEKKVTISFNEQFDPIVVEYGSTGYGENGVLLDYTPTRDGYRFAGWYLDENYDYSAEVTYRYTFTSDVTLYAKWDKQAESYIIWIALAFVAVTIIAFSCWLAFARPKMHE